MLLGHIKSGGGDFEKSALVFRNYVEVGVGRLSFLTHYFTGRDDKNDLICGTAGEGRRGIDKSRLEIDIAVGHTKPNAPDPI